MHPMYWWKRAHAEADAHAGACGHGCGGHGGHGGHGPGGGGRAGWHAAPEGWDHGGGGGGLGVRRPLRFLAHKLDLKEAQVETLARILNELKTERAQAEVDDRRTLAAFADAVAGEAFDEARAKAGGDIRLESANRLRDAVGKALGQIHAMLDPEQRARLAYLIRTGVLTL